jgi:hypothetical protein
VLVGAFKELLDAIKRFNFNLLKYLIEPLKIEVPLRVWSKLFIYYKKIATVLISYIP